MLALVVAAVVLLTAPHVVVEGGQGAAPPPGVRRRLSARQGANPPPPPRPWQPLGPAATAGRPEVVAFYGEDAAVKGQPEDTCTPSFWLDFPPDTVTTIIMQGWNDPWSTQYSDTN